MIKVTEKNTKVYDSYVMTNKDIKAVVDLIILSREKGNHQITRTKQSYIAEIKAHKRLYNLGLFRKHTKDADLEEPIAKWKEIIYFIIGI